MIKIKVNQSESKGALVVLLDDQDRVLILLRPSAARWAPNRWGYPGGKIEKGESSHAAAVRETKEETQLDVWDLKKIEIESDLPCVPYYTREYSGEIEIDYEHDDWKWVRRSEVENYPLAPGVLAMLDWVLKNE